MNPTQLIDASKNVTTPLASALQKNSAGQRVGGGNRQHGVALILALIALAATSLASVALMRSLDTSNLVSGNVSTNETTIQMSEIGTQAVYNCLASSACSIYGDVRPLDAATRLPADPTTNNPVALTWTSVTSPDANFKIDYVIERMCGIHVGGTTSVYTSVTLANAPAPTFANCKVSPIYNAANGAGRWFYRATVRVAGPKNTRAINSTFIGKDSVTP